METTDDILDERDRIADSGSPTCHVFHPDDAPAIDADDGPNGQFARECVSAFIGRVQAEGDVPTLCCGCGANVRDILAAEGARGSFTVCVVASEDEGPQKGVAFPICTTCAPSRADTVPFVTAALMALFERKREVNVHRPNVVGRA